MYNGYWNTVEPIKECVGLLVAIAHERSVQYAYVLLSDKSTGTPECNNSTGTPECDNSTGTPECDIDSTGTPECDIDYER